MSHPKFTALARYVSKKMEFPPLPTLLWVLFDIDMTAYGRFGKPITEATWIKGNQHPVPRFA